MTERGNAVNSSSNSSGASERQRVIDALAAASVVSNSASPRVSGKLKCLDVAAFHKFLDDDQELTCTRDSVNRLIQVDFNTIQIRKMLITFLFSLVIFKDR